MKIIRLKVRKKETMFILIEVVSKLWPFGDHKSRMLIYNKRHPRLSKWLDTGSRVSNEEPFASFILSGLEEYNFES